MRNIIVFVLAVLCVGTVYGQRGDSWQDINRESNRRHVEQLTQPKFNPSSGNSYSGGSSGYRSSPKKPVEEPLGAVTIPEGTTSIAERAYYNRGVTSVTIPPSVTSIGKLAFSENNLTSITIPNSVILIGDCAFSRNQLTSITIPNSVTSIGKLAFSDNNLTSVTISNSVTSIGDFAFSENNLTSVAIPNSVTSIGEYAFSGNNLTSITIPNSVTSIGKQAFGGNHNLTSITIGGNVGFREYAEFRGNFYQVYNENGRKAGTYVYSNGAWSMQ